MAAFNFHQRQTRRWWYSGVALVAVALFAVFYVAGASANLTGSPSNFESGDGNMVVDGTTGSHDWANVSFIHVTDVFSSQTDDSFVSGQKQDTPCPDMTGHGNPPKDDFTDVASFFETASGGAPYLYGATIRYTSNGSASENVELKQGTSGTCPGSNLLARTPNDKLLAFDYGGGGTTVALHVLTWIAPDDPNTTANESTYGGNNGTCFVANDPMPCWGANVLLPSTATFEGEANQTAITAADNPISNAALDKGVFAEFGVNLQAAGIIPAGTCFATAQTVWESRSSGSSFVSTTKDVVLENQTYSNCGTITIIKHTLDGTGTRSGVDQSFSYTTTGGSDLSGFSLNDKNGTDTLCGSAPCNKKVFENVTHGSYTVTETAVNGYSLQSLTCTPSTADSTGSSGVQHSAGSLQADITLGNGGSVTCTFTNKLNTASLSTSVSDAGPVTPGSQVRDTATVTGSVSTLTPSGNVTFYLCSFAAGSTDVCDGSDASHTGTALSPAGTLSGSGATATANSPYVNTAGSALTPGRYCFRAEWPGDTNYVYSNGLKEWGGTSGTGECFTVAKINTQTATTPVDGSGTSKSTITLGSSIYDKAVVTGTSVGGDPTGSVVFHVCKLDSGTCTSGGDLVGDSTGVALVSDGVANTYTSSATSVAFTPTATGRYCFRGDYGGSTVYNGSSDSSAGECFTVTDTTSMSSAQTWLPNDSGTVAATHGAALNGTLTIQLYTGGSCAAGNEVSGQTYTKQLTNATTADDRTLTTTNSSYTVSATATVSWKVSFASTDTNVTGSSHCESSSLTVTN